MNTLSNSRFREYVRILTKCKRACHYGCSSSEAERMNDDGTVVGAIDTDGMLTDMRVMVARDSELPEEKSRALKDVLGLAVTRISRIVAAKTTCKESDKDTPRIDNWVKSTEKNLNRWVENHVTQGGKVLLQWNESPDKHTASIVSTAKGILHINIASLYPDFDIPEDGLTEIKGLLEAFHSEINEVINDRLAYWREEERNGRL